MKKGKTTRLATLSSHEVVTSSAPLVIRFTNWPADAPKDVVLEVLEVDGQYQRKAVSDDLGDKEADVVARLRGTLTSSESSSDPVFERDGDVSVLADPATSRDVIWLKFANDPASKAFAAGVPFTSGETSTSEGAFFELAVRVRDAHDETKVIHDSAVTTVRRRVDVLLFVEPLAQVDSGMSDLAAKRILERFHPGDEEAHKDRRWGFTVVGILGHRFTVLHSSGCSTAITTMLLRYLQVGDPADPSSPIPLFDAKIRRADLPANCRPHVRKSKKDEPIPFANDPRAIKALVAQDARWEKVRDRFVERFDTHASVAGLSKKKRRKALVKKFNAEAGSSSVKTTVVESGVDNSYMMEPDADETIGEHWYPAMLIWKLKELAGFGDHSYALERVGCKKKVLPDVDAFDDPDEYLAELTSDTMTFEGDHGPEPVVLERCETQGSISRFTQERFILLPLTTAFLSAFDLVDVTPKRGVIDYQGSEALDIGTRPRWVQAVVDSLERGVPVIGLFSPGRHSLRKDTGHFCMIVGYRVARVEAADAGPDEREVRFILNDPAKAAGLQYEALTERDLDPDGWRSHVDEAPTRDSQREQRGLNLVIERRKLLSLRQLFIYEPPGWDPDRHARWVSRPAATR